jgi:REP element-mobilizing transposase RayT
MGVAVEVCAYYHVWFSTKGRKEALQGDVGGEVRRLLIDTARRAGIRLLELALVFEHCHLLIALTDEQALPTVMHQLKGATSRYVFLRFPELKLDMRSNAFWQKGYGRREVSPEDVARVRNYLRTQLTRPVRRL